MMKKCKQCGGKYEEVASTVYFQEKLASLEERMK